MKIRYFEGARAASCLASTAGAIYAGIVATLVSPRPISTFEFMGVVTISVIIALPVLAVGSLAFGWRISEFISRRVRTNRVVVFSMMGTAMGIVADGVLILIGGSHHSVTFPRVRRD